MANLRLWKKEPAARIQGSRALDESKVQAPCVVRAPVGGYRLFYTGIGSAKPFENCQGYILSAYSRDGLNFELEEGIRFAPIQEIPHVSLRVLAPSVTKIDGGRWRMYFEARGKANRPTVICSAVSDDQLHWAYEDGIRIQAYCGVGGPRFVRLPDGRGRVYCFAKGTQPGVISATTTNGLKFSIDDGFRLLSGQSLYDSAGITAAEVLPPSKSDELWTMVYSAWQGAPAGTHVPVHPSQDPNPTTNDTSADFAAASIASDIAGFRSRIFVARSKDGLIWESRSLLLEGDGYESDALDAVHAEDMTLIEIENGRYRMYYAACDRHGKWCVVSALCE